MTAASDSAYLVSNQVRIHHVDDEWNLVFTTDEYGTVTVLYNEKLGLSPKCTNLYIPKNCIQHFINALEQFK